MVMVLAAHAAVTPGGNPVGAPILVTFVVEWVTLLINTFMRTVGVAEAAPATRAGLTVIVPVAFTVPPQPFTGIV